MTPDPASARLAWEAETFGFLQQQNWSPQNQNILLAVSGGADSTALFHFWVQTAARQFNNTLAVAHINHGLRASAHDDEAFVKALCLKWNIPFYSCQLDPKTKPARQSTEMWARENRYAFFTEIAEKTASAFILTAHHRDDLVETVFQRLERGTGPRGLAGIPFQRDEKIIRPFLNRTHAEIVLYLQLLREPWREDESNQNLSINRNWFRHRYLPYKRISEPKLDEKIFSIAMKLQKLKTGLDALEEEAALLILNPSGIPTLAREGLEKRLVEDDYDSLTYWLRKLISLTLSQAPFHALPESPQSPQSLLPPRLTLGHLKELQRQFLHVEAKLQVPVSPRISLKLNKQGLYCEVVTHDSDSDSIRNTILQGQKASLPPKNSYSFRAQLRIILDTNNVESSEFNWRWGNAQYKLTARRFPKPAELIFPGSQEKRAVFDADLFSCTFAYTLEIRTRRNGDCFSPYGTRSRSRKLKTFLNEKKVPVGMRNNLPLILSHDPITSRDTIAWVPGLGISEFFKVSVSTTSILELVLTCEIL